eukprot:6179047-Pleurochrysis_carterae.AAC.1
MKKEASEVASRHGYEMSHTRMGDEFPREKKWTEMKVWVAMPTGMTREASSARWSFGTPGSARTQAESGVTNA